MSDNVVLPALSGTVATDDVAVNGGSSAQVQYVKLVDGTANGTAGIPGDATNGLKVNAATVVTALTTIDGRVDGLETLVTATNTKLDTVNANLTAGLITTPSNSTATALDSDGPIAKNSAGTLFGFQGYSAAAGFVQVHNKATAPASTNVPVIVIPVAAGAAFSLDLGVRGRSFATGIAFGFSTTGPTFTDGGNNMWVDAQYS